MDDTINNRKQRYIDLAWQILEHKARYYIADSPTITDFEYDMLEKEYEALADELGLPKTASDMVGFNENRPCCQRVLEKHPHFRKKRST